MKVYNQQRQKIQIAFQENHDEGMFFVFFLNKFYHKEKNTEKNLNEMIFANQD